MAEVAAKVSVTTKRVPAAPKAGVTAAPKKKVESTVVQEVILIQMRLGQILCKMYNLGIMKKTKVEIRLYADLKLPVMQAPAAVLLKTVEATQKKDNLTA